MARRTLPKVTPSPEPELDDFANALRIAMAAVDATTADLARALDAKDDTTAKWVKGVRRPGPPTVFAMEAILRVAPGDLSRHLGYLPPTTAPSVLAAIDADPALDQRSRNALEAAYRAMVTEDR